MYGFIYMTTNLVNGMKYIGQHKGDGTDNYLGSGDRLVMAVKKYGRENFERKILCFAENKDELNQLEIEYILIYNAVESDKFYNIAYGGNINPRYGEDNGMFGRNHSEDSRRKMSTTRQQKLANGEYDYFFGDEFKQKMSNVTKGVKNGMYGKHHSEESKRKMSENSKGLTEGERNGNYGNKGDKAKNGKKIYKYSDASMTQLVEEYNTVRMVLEDLDIKGHSNLYKAIKNGTKYKGFYWSKTK